MRKPNLENNVCPLCCHTLRRNGKTKTGKLRFRCICGFNETVNSTAHNSHKRTLNGYSKLDALNKQRIRTYRAYHTPKDERCLFCQSTENLEQHEFNYSYPIKSFTVCSNCHKHLTELTRALEHDPLNPKLICLLFSHDSKPQFVIPSKSLRVNDCSALVSPTKENRALRLLTEC